MSAGFSGPFPRLGAAVPRAAGFRSPFPRPGASAPFPSPSSFLASFFCHRADLWEPVWVGAADSDMSIAYWRPRYLGLACYFQTRLRPEQAALFGTWDAKTPPAVLHLPDGTLVGGDWAALNRTLSRDGSHAQDYGSCYMADSQPRPVSNAGFNDAPEVQIDCLRVPAAPDGVG